MRRYKLRSACLAMLTLVVGAVSAGPRAADAAMLTGYTAPEVAASPIRQAAIFGGSFGVEDGRTVEYTTTNGSPAVFNVVDLQSYRLLGSYKLYGADNAWAHATASDGTVYIGANGTGNFYRYSPQAKEVVNLGRPIASESTIWDLDTDEAGNVYGATYPGGKVFRYNTATGEVTDYGSMVPGQQYARSIAYANGYVYVGMGTVGSLVRLDPNTGEKVTIAPPAGYSFAASFISGLDVTGGHLIVWGPGGWLYFYNLQNESWSSRVVGRYKGITVSPALDGKIYYVSTLNTVHSFDLNTHTLTNLNIPFTTGMRPATWVELPGDPDFPGKTLATIRYDGFTLFYNPTTGKSRLRASVLDGQPLLLQSMEKGPDGKLYISGYQAKMGAQYDPATGETVTFAVDQVEGMASYGDTMYMGVYPDAIIHGVDTTAAVPEAVRLKVIGEEQDRPFAMTAGGDHLIIGTVPKYGKLGGALTFYNPADGTWSTYRNVVQDQSIISVAYRDGKVYGSTSVWGGLGTPPAATEAKIFVWDVATGTKVTEFTPQIPGIDEMPKAIGQLSFGPDGKLWGAAQGTIFVMDPETLEVERARVIYPSHWNVSHYMRPVYLRWGLDGLLYTTLDGNLTVIDPETLESKRLDEAYLLNVSDDGDLYYSAGAAVKRIRTVTFTRLEALTGQFVTHPGLANSLSAKLRAAGEAAGRGNLEAKQGALGAYVNEVEAQRDKALTPEQADLLIQWAGLL